MPDADAATPAGADGTPDPVPGAGRGSTSRRRAGVLIGVLCLLLGFALAVQVKATSADSGLDAARQEDLVRILDDLSAAQDRLRQDIAAQEALKARLSTGGDQAGAALMEAQQREQQLAILAGTIAAEGPGLRLTVADPQAGVGPEVVLDAVQELRAAGAEAIQIGDVRVGVDTAITGSAGALVVDGVGVEAPYVIIAIGDPQTLETALNIPGGVVNTVNRSGGAVDIDQRDIVVVDALRVVEAPEYAQPAPDQD